MCFTDEGTDPEKLNSLPKVTAKLRFETRPVSCQSPPPLAHNYSLCVHLTRTSRARVSRQCLVRLADAGEWVQQLNRKLLVALQGRWVA